MKLRKRKQDPPSRRSSRAYIVTTRNDVIPFADLEKTQITKTDQQLDDETTWIGKDNLSPHPYPSSSFYFMWESNVMVWRCTKQIATDVAGLGSTVKLREDMPENQTEYQKIMDFLLRPNPDMSFRRINEAFIIDHGVTGNSALQVVRSKDNEVAEVFHMPTGDLWADTGGKRFCQKKGIKKVWFARFGMGEDGKPLVLNPKSGVEDEGLDIKERANEILFYHSYYPKSRWYGVPNMLPATGDILTGLGIRDFNLSFFTHHGVPAYMVSLIGEWDDGTEEDDKSTIAIVREYMQLLKGAKNSHSTLVLDIPKGCEIKVDAISVKVEEGSFKILRTMADQDVLAAYSMPPYRIGIPVRAGSLAGNIAGEMTTNYINGVVEPLQVDLEELWSDNIFRIGLNCPSYELAFKNLDIRDEVIEHEEDSKRIADGTMTRNQYREKRGEKPAPGLDSYTMDANLVTIGEADVEED